VFPEEILSFDQSWAFGKVFDRFTRMYDLVLKLCEQKGMNEEDFIPCNVQNLVTELVQKLLFYQELSVSFPKVGPFIKCILVIK